MTVVTSARSKSRATSGPPVDGVARSVLMPVDADVAGAGVSSAGGRTVCRGVTASDGVTGRGGMTTGAGRRADSGDRGVRPGVAQPKRSVKTTTANGTNLPGALDVRLT